MDRVTQGTKTNLREIKTHIDHIAELGRDAASDFTNAMAHSS